MAAWERELKLREEELAFKKEERELEERRRKEEREFEESRREVEEQRRKEEREFEERRREIEEQRRKEDREIEERRRVEEREWEERRRKEERELEEQRRKEEREFQETQWREDRLLRQEEIERQKRLDEAKVRDESSLVGRTRKFAEAIKHVFPNFPSENAELPGFFEAVENLFKLYEIPIDLQSKLLLPKLSEKATAVVNRLPLAELGKYEAVKTCLLNEFRLTPRELRARFSNAVKRTDETFGLFANRLENALTYYLRSRNADKDLKTLFDVIVADKLKDCLPAPALQYVLSLEGDGCFTPAKVAANADIFVSNYNDKVSIVATRYQTSV